MHRRLVDDTPISAEEHASLNICFFGNSCSFYLIMIPFMFSIKAKQSIERKDLEQVKTTENQLYNCENNNIKKYTPIVLRNRMNCNYKPSY